MVNCEQSGWYSEHSDTHMRAAEVVKLLAADSLNFHVVGCFVSSRSVALDGKHHCLTHHKEQTTYTYGLDHDIQQRLLAKQDPAKQAACQRWLEQLTHTTFPSDFQSSLKSGTILCQAVNTVWPNTIAKVNTGSMPFVQRENLVSYINACKAHGMRETDLFMSDDLYEGKNLVSVVDNICALGVLAREVRGLPVLAVGHGAVSGGGVVAPVGGPVSMAEVKNVTPALAVAKPAAGGDAGTKFCGTCGAKRTGAAQKFCGECGKPF